MQPDKTQRTGVAGVHPSPSFILFCSWGKCSKYTGMITSTLWLVTFNCPRFSFLFAVYFLFCVRLNHLMSQHPWWMVLKCFLQNNTATTDLADYSCLGCSYYCSCLYVCAAEFLGPLSSSPVGVGLHCWCAVSEDLEATPGVSGTDEVLSVWPSSSASCFPNPRLQPDSCLLIDNTGKETVPHWQDRNATVTWGLEETIR